MQSESWYLITKKKKKKTLPCAAVGTEESAKCSTLVE